jgi:outer membrane receptor protein involved in Fe transport
MKKHLWLSASAAALVFTASQSAVAQTADSGSADASVSDADIVVTAQKRDQRLLDVPVAVSAITSDTLISQNINSLKDYFSRVPGLQYGGQNTASLSIRGVTTGERLANPTVAIVVDDVPFGSSTYLGQSLIPDFDPATLDRIEVLRGPQGTLYGASSLGGLIKYVTRRPDMNDFSGRIELGANTVKDGGEGYSARGSINVPIVTDKVALSVSGFYREEAPFIDNIDPFTGVRTNDINTSKYWGGRAALSLNPVEGVTIDLAAVKQRRDSVGTDAFTTYSITDFRPVFPTNNSASPRYRQLLGNRTQSVILADGRTDFEIYSARIGVDLGFAELTSVSAWSKSRVATVEDSTNRFGFVLGPYPGYTGVLFNNGSRTNKFSQEIRLAGSGPAIDWLVGGFYTKEKSDAPQSLVATGSGADVVAYAGLNPSRYRDQAVFADVTYHATPEFDIQVGGRYSGNKQAYSYVQQIDPASEPIFGPSSVISSGLKENAFTWLVTPSYKITPDIMIFFRAASGYRPGGPNANLPTIPLTTFGSDRVVNYELGLKGNTPDKQLTFDVSLFQIDWTKIQLQNTDAASAFVYFSNGSKARSRGAEASLGWRPLRGLAIDGNLTYTQSELRATLPAQTPGITSLIGAKGDRLPNTPKFTANLSIQQDFDLSDDVSAYVGGTFTHIDDRLGQFVNVAGGLRPRLPAYTNLDLRAGVSFQKRWDLSFYVRNLFDQEGVLTSENAGGTQTVPTVTFVVPRTIGVVLSTSF